MNEEQTRLLQEIRDSLAQSLRCQQQSTRQQQELLEHQQNLVKQQQIQRRWAVMFAVGTMALVLGANAMLFSRVLRPPQIVPMTIAPPYAPPTLLSPLDPEPQDDPPPQDERVEID